VTNIELEYEDAALIVQRYQSHVWLKAKTSRTLQRLPNHQVTLATEKSDAVILACLAELACGAWCNRVEEYPIHKFKAIVK